MNTKLLLTCLVALTAITIGMRTFAATSAEDKRIVSAAKESYTYRTYLKDDHIKIQSEDGIVTLEGDVSTASRRNMAEDTVENLPGVKRVDNRLVVKTSPANEKADDWIEFKVKSALLFHRSVSAKETAVTVNDGVVTLRGNASSEAQKELTAEYAEDIEGVKVVKNELKVSLTAEPPSRTIGEVIDDASITAQVKSALVTHRSTSALKTKVTTREGVVTLGGVAKNRAEKDLVTKLVRDIHGVKRVMNNMEVGG